MCGGTAASKNRSPAAGGLSPRVRGNRNLSARLRKGSGTIPACAGEPGAPSLNISLSRDYPRVCGGTLWDPTTRTLTRDYPRVCGGTDAARGQQNPFLGLSPRVRGNRGSGKSTLVRKGTIPACAGEPFSWAWSSTSWRDYPRVCGGTGRANFQSRQLMGLSPRVRGNRNAADPRLRIPGTIPACAGEPWFRPAALGRRGDYPRVCGGTQRLRVHRRGEYGLSPRVRGNRNLGKPRQNARGTIPACAGEPRRPESNRRGRGDYPRVCGGTGVDFPAEILCPGLSPRVRGNRPSQHDWDGFYGTIPACAGEPGASGSPGSPEWDYPRVCGGTGRVVIDALQDEGLSPRVRGNLAFGLNELQQRGLSPRVRGNRLGAFGGGRLDGTIPACAGEPADRGLASA